MLENTNEVFHFYQNISYTNYYKIYYIMLCKYADMFGKPNQGLHKFRIFDIAIVDVIATFILAKVLKRFVFPKICIKKITIWLFLAGIVLHKFFCVNTTVNKLLFN